MNDCEIRQRLLAVRQEFPKALWKNIPEVIEKDVWHFHLAYLPKGRVIDLGGGYSPTSAVMAQLGAEVTVVDRFCATPTYETFSAPQLCEALRQFGVNVVQKDLRDYDPTQHFPAASVDSIVSHDTLYFFHPRALIDQCMTVLKPGGKFAINVNNGVSVLRRLRAILGKNMGTSFRSYFFENEHHRYWTPGDLRALAEYLHLSKVQIVGRNWSVYESRRSVPRRVLRVADRVLRTIPSLCNDIYLIGQK